VAWFIDFIQSIQALSFGVPNLTSSGPIQIGWKRRQFLFFNKEIMKRPAFVKFYKPGCIYCEAMKPEWNDFIHRGLA
jgi:thiol-disulfide isomerase/thioredoxin